MKTKVGKLNENFKQYVGRRFGRYGSDYKVLFVDSCGFILWNYNLKEETMTGLSLANYLK